MQRDGSGVEPTIDEDPNLPPFDLSLLTPEEALESLPEFKELIELWMERRNDAPIPDWGDVDFADFRGWHYSLVITAFEGEEPDPKWKIVGELFREMSGANATVMRFSEIVPSLYTQQLRNHFAAVRDKGLIGLSVGRIANIGRGHVPLRVLELPFTEGGTRVERLVHIVSQNGDIIKV